MPIAWGHLDPEGNRTWLGVAVAHGYTRQGYGSTIVKLLCEYADEGGWGLYLTCNKELTNWYEKFGFFKYEGLNGKDYCYRGGRVYRKSSDKSIKG
jgi:GNAT superfamily N-acetyltransferase